MKALTQRVTIGFAFIAVMFLVMVFGSIAHHIWWTRTCHGNCVHDRACQKRCLDRNYCPYGE